MGFHFANGILECMCLGEFPLEDLCSLLEKGMTDGAWLEDINLELFEFWHLSQA